MKDKTGTGKGTPFSVYSFPRSRIFTADIGILGAQKHHVKALVEFDVTGALLRIREINSTGKVVSFTSWIVSCAAKALSQHPHVHAVKNGKTSLAVFDEVDITIMIEKESDGVRIPLPYVLRRTSEKDPHELFAEIEEVKKRPSGGAAADLNRSHSRLITLFSYFPRQLRLFIWKMMLKDPVRVKKMMGTSLITSVGTAGSVSGWAIPYSIHPVSFTLGSIVKKPCAIENSVQIRDLLAMTVLIDHDTVDGVPAARFITDLKQLIENAAGL